MHNHWHDSVIHPSDTLRKAIETIDDSRQQIALVADDEYHLLGTVTDGDIRRALIQHSSLDTCITQIMNRNPIVVSQQEPLHSVRSLMQRKGLSHVPMLHQGVLTGMHTLRQLTCPQRYDNPVFLMAGGFGTRLRPLTNNCPKPLLKVGDKPILQTIIERFIDAGFYRFYLSTHYLNDMIQAYFGDGSHWGIDIQYVHEPQPLGTAGALGLLPADLPDLPLIMMNGDLLTNVNIERLLHYHQHSQAWATLGVREYEYQVPYGVIQSESGYITEIEEKPTQHFFINAGIYVISPQLRRQVTAGQVIDMPDLISQHIDRGHAIAMFPIHEYWLDIGRMPDYQQAQHDFHTAFTAARMQ